LSGICVICGKEYSLKGHWKTCSKECSRKYFNLRHKPHNKRFYERDPKRHIKRTIRNHKKKLARIRTLLGNKCSVCGSSQKLIFHHLRYRSEVRSQTHPTLKDLKAGNLVLVCRKHHRYITIIANLKRNGELEKTLALVNENTPYIL